ncbi:hypothetical protein PTSG_04138 [Salpingoeca rosetta]|uniref:PCI domain-containing protein n=1 Tax=Salpingoeca rosetta (strain ATCC 50818 / BSB-021) TaxID=946362 RepID=F2U6P7_SALR5|nr:uncharacterized protein PTSG_04138 [Salpingoeca rosetta]EGD83529.1 hypothetical protein PTSG_04138 [Salpingoeca rosetta]|eukprot:XP_004995033.1 hypothetical protein PTSG_04138 [Salpingoeca rosetta]
MAHHHHHHQHGQAASSSSWVQSTTGGWQVSPERTAPTATAAPTTANAKEQAWAQAQSALSAIAMNTSVGSPAPATKSGTSKTSTSNSSSAQPAEQQQHPYQQYSAQQPYAQGYPGSTYGAYPPPPAPPPGSSVTAGHGWYGSYYPPPPSHTPTSPMATGPPGSFTSMYPSQQPPYPPTYPPHTPPHQQQQQQAPQSPSTSSAQPSSWAAVASQNTSAARSSSSSTNANAWAWSTGKTGPTLLDVKMSSAGTSTAPAAKDSAAGVRFSLTTPARKTQPSTPFAKHGTTVSSGAFITADTGALPSKKAKSGGSSGGGGVSEAFKQYCLKCYGSCANKKERMEMKSILKSKYEQAKASGATVDWTSMPIPELKSKKKKGQSASPAKHKRTAKQRKQQRSSWLKEQYQARARRKAELVVGTCMDLEKEYFRIKDEVDPSTVRPEPVLREAFKHVKQKFKRGGVGYKWIWSQLKAIRQDLTVQHIRNKFTVQVYETHARIALEYDDHEEFNQCQSQLNRLYKEGIEGSREEFLAYRLLEYMYKQSDRDLGALLAELTEDERHLPNIRHALSVLKAYSCSNYAKFFKLYDTAPGMAPYLMDMLMVRVRKRALAAFAKAYRPSVPLTFIQEYFRFDARGDLDKFLKDMAVENCVAKGALDCRAATRILGVGTFSTK